MHQDVSQQITVYKPNQRHELGVFETWRIMTQNMVRARELIWQLFKRDLLAGYKKSFLGFTWLFISPILGIVSWVFLQQAGVLETGELSIPYPAYVIMGTVFFALFLDALNAPLKQVQTCRAMLVKIRFPREALILSAIGQVLFSFAIKLGLLVATLLILQVPVQPTFLLAIIPLLGLLLMGIALGLLLTPVGLLFHDITHGLTVAGNALLFLTPVVYPPPLEGALGVITAYNPLTPLLMSARGFVVGGAGDYTISMLIVILATVVLLSFGWLIFRLALPILIERIGI